MPWDVESWDHFLDTTVQIATGRRHDWRNSFLLYPYDPTAEAEALVQVQNALPRITIPPVTTEVLSWGALMAAFLRKQGFLRSTVASAQEAERLQQNLVVRLPEQLAESTSQALAGKPRTHVAFIVRTGAIFPFTTVSQTLAACERRALQATLAVLGPGRVADQGRAFGLLTGVPHSGYPALIVGRTDIL
jgi:hypothetical protein